MKGDYNQQVKKFSNLLFCCYKIQPKIGMANQRLVHIRQSTDTKLFNIICPHHHETTTLSLNSFSIYS